MNTVFERIVKIISAAIGAIMSFFVGMPPVMWVLIGMMTLDYATGLITGAMGVSNKTQGGRMSSKAAFEGLIKKVMILLVVLLAVLLDMAVETGAGVSFSAVTGATCLWFIASEGVSVLENASALGVPIPGILKRALEMMREGNEDKKENMEEN